MRYFLPPGRRSGIRSALTAIVVVLVGISPSLAGSSSAATAECPIDVGKTYGYTLAAAQSALAAVSTSCRTVVFSAGTYLFNGQLRIKASGVTVTGADGAVIKPSPGVWIDDGLINVRAASVTLSGLTLEVSGGSRHGISSSASNTVISDTSVTGVKGRGIYMLTGAADARITSCTVTDSGAEGIATQAHRTTVDGCTVSGSRSHGMWAFSGADGTAFINNTVMNGNRVGIEFIGATNFTAAGNFVHDNHLMGIHLLRSDGGLLDGNTVYLNTHNGIDSHGSTQLTIQNNTVHDNGGIRFPETLEGQGIIAFCSQYIDILSNTVYNNSQNQAGKRDGIHVSDSQGRDGSMRTAHIKIDGNTVYDEQATGTQTYAIHIGGPSNKVIGDITDVTVTHNRGWGNLKPGIRTNGLAPDAIYFEDDNILTAR